MKSYYKLFILIIVFSTGYALGCLHKLNTSTVTMNLHGTYALDKMDLSIDTKDNVYYFSTDGYYSNKGKYTSLDNSTIKFESGILEGDIAIQRDNNHIVLIIPTENKSILLERVSLDIHLHACLKE